MFDESSCCFLLKFVSFCSGYMSPEYAMHNLFSIKSDVYSFGVLLLEIISGRKNHSLYQTDKDSAHDLITYVSFSNQSLY